MGFDTFAGVLPEGCGAGGDGRWQRCGSEPGHLAARVTTLYFSENGIDRCANYIIMEFDTTIFRRTSVGGWCWRGWTITTD